MRRGSKSPLFILPLVFEKFEMITSILESRTPSRYLSPRRDVAPLFLKSLSGAGTSAIRLACDDGAPALHDEAWLRDLVFDHPELLPIGEIEPVLDPLFSACIELPLASGNADNLFLNSNGGIALVECKLWRNPEARRKVVAQVIDYARCLTTWRYDDLERAVLKASLPGGAKTPQRIADLFGATGDFDEVSFIDNINRNLKRGRIVLILAGDGIREDAEALVDLVQDTAGARFTWALVEMPVFQLPDKLGFVVQPRLIARTVMIERGVVSISDDRIRVAAPLEKEPSPKSITEDEFFEAVAKLNPQLPTQLRTLIDKVTNVGVRPVFKGAMNLRWMGPDGVDRSLGYVQKDGQVWFDPVDRSGADQHERQAADMYLDAVATGLRGVVKNFPNSDHRSIYVDNHAPRISKLLEAQANWVDAIQAFTDRIRSLKSD
jgi:hypothetical protein